MADRRQALETLYRASLAEFISERTRLAAALRAAGDEESAKELSRRRRPTASVWAVNQLYWQARDVFDALLAAGARLKKGDLGGTSAYRTALGELRKRAAAVLQGASHSATAATLGRVTGTLAAIAAAGSFDPDPPGALSADREPPGFDTPGMQVPAAEHRAHRDRRPRTTPARVDGSEAERVAASRAEERARKQAAAKAREAERHRLQTALRDAVGVLRKREEAASRLQNELRAAEKAVDHARQAVRDLERKLEILDHGD